MTPHVFETVGEAYGDVALIKCQKCGIECVRSKNKYYDPEEYEEDCDEMIVKMTMEK